VFTDFMNFVEPIRDRKKIAQIKNLLRGEKRFRDLLLFTVAGREALSRPTAVHRRNKQRATDF
jgi:hypothetical protein